VKVKCGGCEGQVSAGDLRHKVTIQSPPTTLDDSGHPTGSWTTVRTVCANVMPLRGRELFNAQQAQVRTTHKVTIRYMAGVTGKQRLLFGTRTLEIDSVINVEERNHTLELMCFEES
jgi:SPP1 family predicted phage head-tail adaptor